MKVSKAKLNKFAEENSWRNKMDNASGLDSWDNYGGEDMGHAVVVIGQNRDSEMMEQSNFDAALNLLGGESDTVKVERFGHWGCGWFELILVDPSDTKSLSMAYEIKQKLNEYPLLDEDDYYERENEYQHDYAESAKHELATAIVKHLGLPEELIDNEDLVELAYYLNIQCQRNYGNDSCIDVYSFREPDANDWEDFIQCVKLVGYNTAMESNLAYQYLVAAFNLDGDE